MRRDDLVELDIRQEQTRLIQDGQAAAVLSHAPGLLDDDQLVENVATAARLALENERLQAEVQARLVELRESRARIVEAGDAERKRLERDLHDGAQQRLVGLSLSLRLARLQLATGAAPDAVARLDRAESELREAIVELRELAHGIFPAVLADEGLAAAVEALAEDGRVPIRIRSLPEGRFALGVETAAYTVVAEAVRATTSGVAVRRRGRATHSSWKLKRMTKADSTSSPSRIAWVRSTVGSLSSAARTGTSHSARSCRAIVIADDETLLREGLARLLDEAGVEVVGKAASADELRRRVDAAGRRDRRHQDAADAHR